MKKTNILYWTFTGIFAAFMFLSGIQNALITPESVELLMTKLGYPQYIIPFLGVAKCLGAIAIVVPGFPRLKEWAYAGLFFDLLGATYSGIMAEGFHPLMLTMLIFFGFEALSYIYYHKRQRQVQGYQVNQSTPVTA
ncbi:MAG: DoxX family protein [Cyclobacteriaceae bacterium]